MIESNNIMIKVVFLKFIVDYIEILLADLEELATRKFAKKDNQLNYKHFNDDKNLLS